MNKKNCTLAGHRPNNLPHGSDENHPENLALKRHLEEKIKNKINEGYKNFYCGMEIGCEMWAGEIVLALKKDSVYQNSDIKLIAVLASEEQANDWDEDTRERYFDSFSECDDVIYTANRPSEDALCKRNDYLAQHTHCLITVFAGNRSTNTADLLKKVQEQDSEIVMIPLKSE